MRTRRSTRFRRPRADLIQMTTRLLPQRLARRLGTACMAVSLSLGGAAAFAQSEHQFVLDAREALRKKDKAQLVAATVTARQHPLAQWVEYWELGNRLSTAAGRRDRGLLRALARHLCRGPAAQRLAARAGQAARLGQLQPRLPALSHERRPRGQLLFPAHPAPDGQDVRDDARSAWFAQRDLDDGCNLLAGTLYAAGQLSEADAWQKARLAIEFNRPRVGARRGGAGRAGGGRRGGRAQREPGPLPEPQGAARRRRRGRAGHAGACCDWPATTPTPPPASSRNAGRAACRAIWPRWPGPAPASRRRRSCCPTPRRTTNAPGPCSASRAPPPSAIWRPGPTTRWPGRCARRCAAPGWAMSVGHWWPVPSTP